jgi:hypothetical protein
MEDMHKRNPAELHITMDEGFTGRALAEGRLTHIDITEGLRQLCMADDSTSRTSTPRPSVPQWPRGEKTGSRPRLLKKAATAPPGGIYILTNVPEPPRRAISARVAVPGSPRDHRTHQGWLLFPKLPRLSLYRTRSESRSFITRRKSVQKSGAKVGLKPRGKVWRMLPASSVRKYEALSSELEETQRSVLFEKRKKTGGPQHIEILRPRIVDFNARALPDTPGSMVNTPREFYPPSAVSPGEVRRPLHPLRPTTIRANSSSGASAQPAEYHQSGPEPARRSGNQVVLRSGSILAIVPPEETAWKQQVYLPGPIQLAQHTAASAVSRKGSVATLEPFIGAVEAVERRPSDDAALDGIVAYFKELNVVDSATDDALDQFWQSGERLRRSLEGQREQLGAVKSPQAAQQSQPWANASSPSFEPPPPIPKLVPPDEERKGRPATARTASQSRIKLRRLFHSATSKL